MTGKYDFQFLRIKRELEQLQAQLEGVQATQKSQTVDEARMAEIAALLEQFRGKRTSPSTISWSARW